MQLRHILQKRMVLDTQAGKQHKASRRGDYSLLLLQTKFAELPQLVPTLDSPLGCDPPVRTGDFPDGRRIVSLKELLQKVRGQRCCSGTPTAAGTAETVRRI